MAKVAVLKRDLVVPAGTEFPAGASKREWFEANYEACVGEGDDAVLYLTIGESDIAECPDLFEIREE
ncbi:hypothetical protein LCGC14_3026960 [marine sediment metagenome]|uniref:Uncharacterized protein n=1 Tax=marine sediment metagenome TaxID=412755 RepID=A0A0F8Z163_9ZZZZ